MGQELPPILPIFPLHGAVLMPRAILPLNIFEPRYLAMIRDALDSHKCIGMVQPRPDTIMPELYQTGCVGRITEWEESDDNRIILTLTGITRFRIIEEMQVTTPYRQVRADYVIFCPDLIASPELHPAIRKQLMDDLKLYLDVRGLGADWESVGAAGDETIVAALTMLCPFSSAEKQALLEAPDLSARTDVLSTLLTLGAEGDEPKVRH
jgi:uncharacterized protein